MRRSHVRKADRTNETREEGDRDSRCRNKVLRDGRE